MSFYDDASLVFLPSGQAGKDGKAYSMKPVPEYGTDLVTNGDFATDSDWQKTNATISGGVATITSTGYAYAAIVQNNVLTIGNTYYATIDVNSIVGGLIVGTSETITNSGIASVTFTATTTYLDIRRDSSFATTTAVIDNVSVREVVVGDGDFTFSRGSNLTATRVDSNGLIEKGRENLLLQSNSFDTTWSPTSASVTSGQSGYDGSNDAWLLSKSGANGRVRQTLSQSGVNTFSVYVKSGTSDWTAIVCGSGTAAYFDLSNGTKGNLGSSAISSSISSIGNGWYRCSVNANISVTFVDIYVADSNGVVSGTSGSIYIQDAQTEIGLVPTEYIESGATSGLAGILEDSPRFDYSGGASCPSLLLEGSRTQLVGYSEYFEGNTSQAFTNATKEGFTESPEGLNNAYELTIITPNTNAAYDLGRFNTTIGEDYTYSVYLKSSGTFDARIYASRGTTEIKNIVVTSEWQRFDLTFTSDNADKDLVVGFGDFNFANPAQTISIYGLQLEEGSHSSSYIPNHSGGSVTREADSCSGAGTSSTFNADEGVFYAEISTNTDDTDKAISLNNAVSGSLNNRLWMGYSTSNKRIYALGYVNNSLQFALSKLMTDESLFVKIACRYKRNDIAFFVNGVKVGTDTTALNFTELSSLDFNIGTAVSGASPLYGNVKQVLVFNSYLSDSEIITLTS